MNHNKDDIVERLNHHCLMLEQDAQERGKNKSIYPVIGLINDALLEMKTKDARIAELEAEVERFIKIAVHPLEGEYLEEKHSEGFWKSCSGCHETNEGAETGYYPYHPFFECYLGSGCHECGYLGAVWDDTDYEHMAKFMREYQEEPTP